MGLKLLASVLSSFLFVEWSYDKLITNKNGAAITEATSFNKPAFKTSIPVAYVD